MKLHTNYAAAAYCSRPKLSNWTCGYRCFGNVTVEKIFHDELKGAYGYIAVIGNHIYAKILQTQLISQSPSLKHKVTRITHKNDVIVHLPPSKEGFIHHVHELWVKDNKQSFFCDDIVKDSEDPVENPECLAGIKWFDISVHLFIWNTTFTTFC
ncbi:5277_t:CDS:2 [Racocetra fulgida]|uniref:5277_t:CDS:1 n=1 Tax=Racocetra fulgida TaxID=60492 RepID=A0A9N9AEF2_9GLOM|nr:5277_t:CDS:2 [Racocetra fulgida]